MKINAKLFLLTFLIITFVSVTSAFIYHTLAQQLLQKQQSKALINSANDFIFVLQEFIENIDSEYHEYSKSRNNDIDQYGLDFIIETQEDSLIIKEKVYVKNDVKIYTEVKTISEFLKYNTNLIVRNIKDQKKNKYYGRQINNEILNTFSEKIRSEIAFIEGNVVSKFTNSIENQYYLPNLSKVTRELKSKNNFELVHESINEVDFSATHYSPQSSVLSNKIDFLIFSLSKEASAFKDTMNLVTAIIVISGIFLTIIFHFVFTTKFRNQIEYITAGLKSIASGNFKKRVKIITQDEIGELGNAFNNMLDEIEKRDLAEKEYSEFISLINKNPSLEEIGKATLQKIINLTNVDVGAFYLYDNNELIPFALIGITNANKQVVDEYSLYKKAKDKKELIEIRFTENHPIIKTGITDLRINYLYILPIFYNNEILAILELASVNNPSVDIKTYLDKIKDQLAIGLANGKGLSDLKKLVNELQNLNKAYQEQNIEITDKNAELLKLHEKLKDGSKQLEIQTSKAVESEKLKSQFLANMSHELRTPQNSILGLTELILKDESTSPKTRERLNVVLSSGKKLLTLIENILEYSKLESGISQVVKSKIKLSELLNEIQSYVAPLFFEREIEFIVESPKQFDYEIYTDIKKFEQIIYNLVGNAAKFTEKGYIKLKLDIINNDLEFMVEDTGPGISEEDSKIIFEEFRQADANLNRKFSGTGLGLAICKRYTELLNGTINVESKLSKGSKFLVKIPDIISEKIEKSLKDNKPDSIKALIVSDGKESIKLISDYLKTHNIIVEVKNSYQISCEVIESINPQIIILDILFNNKNGWKFLYELKSNSAISNIPTVIVNMDEEANCGLGLNVFEYYSEKLSRENIHKAIENIEQLQSIKFRKLLFIMEDKIYLEIENALINDELKIYQTNGKNSVVNFTKRNEPDLIIINLFDKNIESFKILTELNDDLYTKGIPILAFLEKFEDHEEQKYFDNSLIENTLLSQYHPLDVLKIIKDRIELIDNTAFEIDKNITIGEHVKQSNIHKNTSVENKIKVLVVDDNYDARFTIGEIVEALGYQPSFATNGVECLEYLNEEIPDLVLLDIMMPQMDGFQTIKKIREKYKDLNVYALTAYAMLSDRDIIEKNGFNGLITKPINTAQLERKLNQIFDTIS
ncbi:MAG: response regulator [Ignavibacteriales bacterium]|nr:response regulator [Ignavibacteriales bacterium]